MSATFRLWRGVSVQREGDPFGWVRSSKITPELEQLKQRIITSWQKLASEKIKSPEMLIRFQQAMQVDAVPASADGFRIEFRLKGMWGQAIERGWAPIGPKWEDGYGEYDGATHDMRVLLLAGADTSESGVKYRRVMITNSLGAKAGRFGKQTPLQYTISKMRAAQVPESMAAPTQTRVRAGGDELTKGQVKYRQDVVSKTLTHASRTGGLKIPDLITEDPSITRYPGSDPITHKMSMLKNAFIKRDNGARQLTTFRTVTSDTSAGNWMSRGIPPANTFDAIGALTGELLREAFKVTP